MENNNSDFNITLFETCELLNRSKKSISRYIRRGLLHPQEVKSLQGTLEYRFSKDDIEAFKVLDQTGQDRTDRTRQTGHFADQTGHQKDDNKAKTGTADRTEETDKTGHKPEQTGHDSEVITLLKETTGLLKDQLIKKDEQIKDLGGKIDQLIERDRETNFILKGLQDKVFMLGGGKIKPDETEETGHPEHIVKQDAEGEGSDADKQRDNSEKQQDESIDEAINEVIEPIYQTAGQTRQDQTGQDAPIKADYKRAGFWKRVFTNKS